MDLPNLLSKFKSNPPPAHQFVAVEITPYAIKSAVWQVKGSQTEIVSMGSVQTWETENDDDLLTALDQSLTDSLAGTDLSPNEVIFGLPETWVSDSSIADNKKPLIKLICQKLALKPVGFVVSTEAIIHYLKDTEGGPPSGILLHLAPQEIAVSLVYLGNLMGTQVVGRSQDLSADVEEGLARFPQKDTLPSRMILYDARDDLEAAKQDLISHDWLSHLPFMHFPKIESLAKDTSIQAVALAGGAEVAKSLGLAIDENLSRSQPSEPPETPIADEVTEPEIAIKNDTLPPPPKPEPTPTLPAEPALTQFGFKSVALNNNNNPRHMVIPPPPPRQPAEPEVVLEPPPAEIQPPSPGPRFNPLAHLGNLISRFKPHLSRSVVKRVTPHTFHFPGLLLAVPIILAMVLVAGGLAYWYIPKAEVTLFLNQKPLVKEATFTLNLQASALDLQHATIPGTSDDVTVTGHASTTTTGTKTIGDKAKGKAVIFNRTTSSKSFPAGTLVKYNNLSFTTDTAISIASASAKSNADFSITIEPTKVEVGITAAQIGAQSNLPAGSELAIQNFTKDSFIGTTTTALMGGSSQDIQVVAKTDTQKVRTDLQKQLEAQIVSELKQKSNGESGVVPTDKIDITDESYDHKEGEEATSLTLTMTMKETVYVYKINDVTMIAESAVQNTIPRDYTVNAPDTQVEVVNSSLDTQGNATINAKISLMLLPKIDTDEVTRNLVGKYPAVAQQYLSGLPGFARYEMTIEPKLPARLSTLPRQASHIHLTVKPA